MAQINPKTGLPWFTPEDVDRVNQERAMGLAAGEAMAHEIPYTLATPPERTSPGILFTKIGAKNRAGDICVLYMDPTMGVRYRDDASVPEDVWPRLRSVFRCSRNDMHNAYADENENRIGCPQCFIAGGGDTAQRDERDEGSDREEKF